MNQMKGLIGNKFDSDVVSINEFSLSYIPIPKAANTSILNALFKALPSQVQDERIEKIKAANWNLTITPEMPTIVHPARHIMFDVQKKSKHDTNNFIFTCVRHPLTRFISFYKDKIRGGIVMIEKLQQLGFQYGMTVQDCVNHLVNLPHANLDEHLVPNIMFIYYEGQNLCDLVLKVEHIGQGWDYLNYCTGVPFALEHQNKTNDGTEDQSLLDEVYAKKIEDYYWEDMVLLNYSSKAR